MRIIKAAKLETERVETCWNCSSVLGVTMDDLKWENMAWSFKCAVCGKSNQYASKSKEDLFRWIMEDKKDEISSNNTVRVDSI